MVSMLISACGSGQLPVSPLTETAAPTVTVAPTVTPLPTHTSTPAPTHTPTASPTPAITIKTSEGVLAVTKVEIVDTFPPGCDASSLGCSKAASGHVILVVWLEPFDGQEAPDSSKLINMPIYVTDADESRTKIFAGGILNGGLFVAFTPPATASGFVLDWPDSSPVELGQ